MARPRVRNLKAIRRARCVVGTTKNVDELREALSILIPEDHSSTLEETARTLGISRATVARLQNSFRAHNDQAAKPPRNRWGGRRWSFMSWDEELEFLRPWTDLAKKGQVLVVSPIRAALAQRLERPVSASFAYRLLDRHGWRKLAPDTRHPNSDLTVQEAWKKNSRMIWKPS